VRPQERREDGLTSTTRQKPSWGKRGGWGKVTIISHGVEISIIGGGGEKLRDYPLVLFSLFSLFFVIMCSLFLGTKSLMQR